MRWARILSEIQKEVRCNKSQKTRNQLKPMPNLKPLAKVLPTSCRQKWILFTVLLLLLSGLIWQAEAQSYQTFSTISGSTLKLASSPPIFGTFYLASQLD
jgi:hypothetical protein